MLSILFHTVVDLPTPNPRFTNYLLSTLYSLQDFFPIHLPPVIAHLVAHCQGALGELFGFFVFTVC